MGTRIFIMDVVNAASGNYSLSSLSSEIHAPFPSLDLYPPSATYRAHMTNTTTIPPADISEILKHIPHRYPFLLIDRMEACEPKKWVRVIKNVSNNDWFFAGVPARR